MIKIAVICFARFTNFPPVQALVVSLLNSGYCVDAFLFGDSSPLGKYSDHKNLNFISLGDKKKTDGIVSRAAYVASAKRIVRGAISKKNYDLVWTTTDTSARDTGRILFNQNHIMQLLELVEYTPLFMDRPMPIHSSLVPELAKRASRVVVPEYNRSFIQQAYWNLPQRPYVLPNKSVISVSDSLSKEFPLYNRLKNEERKILLYQGVIGTDRNLEPISKATELLDGEFVFFIMGRPFYKGGDEEIKHLCHTYQNTEYLGFYPAPQHLLATPYGHIGLLPYSARGGKDRFSDLNALYCAPNKIWEYSKFGLPMVGSDVPGITSIFSKERIGETVDFSDSSLLAKTISQVSSRHSEYAKRSISFYNSVDYDRLVRSIVEEAI